MSRAEALRRQMFLHRIVACVCAIVALQVVAIHAHGEAAAAPPPIEHYARLPAFSNAVVSPDGAKIVVLRPLNDVLTPTVIDVVNPRITVALKVDPAKFQVRWCDWASNTRLVCMVVSPFDIKEVYQGGRAQIYSLARMLAMNVDGSNLVVLGQRLVSEGGRRELGYLSTGQANLVSLLPQDDDHILFAIAQDFGAEGPQVLRVNVHTNEMEVIHDSERGIYDWMADERGSLRLGLGVTSKFRYVTRRVTDSGGSAEVLLPVAEDEYPDILAVLSNGIAWVPLRNGQDRTGIYEVSLANGAIVRELYRHDTYDAQGYAVGADSAEPIGLRVFQDIPRFVPTNEQGRAIAAELERALPGRVNVPVSVSASHQQLTLTSGLPHGPTRWYFYDRTNKRLILIGSEYPELDGKPLADTRLVTYSARDGVAVPALLMRPRGASTAGPAVVLPHGGPFARQVGEFDPIAEALVAHGVTVLAPDFRGTPGYGYRYQIAGRGQWGRAMQDDLTDGIDWLVAQGLADAKRVCMLGLSYGGYASLAAAYMTPQKLRCAVSVAGPTSLRRMVRDFDLNQASFFDRARTPMLLGDRDLYDELSPLTHPARFGVPVLMLHGGNDRIVPPEHSRELAAALQRAGKPVEHVELPLSGHSVEVGSERRRMFDAALAFIRRHLLAAN